MLIQNSVYRNTYVANGTTTTFAYTTPILDASWLTVYQQLPDTGDEEQTIVSPSDYTLTGVGHPEAGNVIFNEAPANGTRLAIVLSVPITQLHKYAELDNFPAESHEDALAKLTLICQMLAEKAARAVTVAETSTRDPSEYSDDFFVTAEQVQANADQVAEDKEAVEAIITGFDDHADDKKDEVTAAVRAEGDTQIGRVQDEGDTQIGRVQDEGDTQVGRVQDEGAVQVGLATDQAEAAEASAQRAEAAADEAEEIIRPSPATTSSLGLMQVGDGLSVTEAGVVSADLATTQAPGRMQVGDGLSVTETGVVSVDIASAQTAGRVKIGNGIDIAQDGTISAQEVGVATEQVVGVVKVGDNLSIAPDGTLSADAQGGSSYTETITGEDVSDYADGALVVTNDSYGDSADAILAEVEQEISNSTVRVPSSHAVKQYTQGVPVGTIIWSANAEVPAGYLLCNGSAVGRETYPELFAAISTTYGSGDGSTTFNLPNLIGKFIEGSSTAGTEHHAGLPNITGVAGDTWNIINATGAFNGTSHASISAGSGAVTYGQANFDASRSNPIYGNSQTVQPESVTALPCIKAFNAITGDATIAAGQLINEVENCVKLDGSNIEYAGSVLKEYMAHMGMPDTSRVINLTFPSNGAWVIAPADGYYTLIGNPTASNNRIQLNVCTTSLLTADTWLYSASNYMNDAAWNTSLILPVMRGAHVRIDYQNTNGNQAAKFAFIYAVGATTVSNS